MSRFERIVIIGTASLGAVVIIIAFIVIVLTQPLEIRRVASPAMEPILKVNDIVLVEKVSVLLGATFDRGEIIEFSAVGPDEVSERFVIRRVVGLPGDKVRVDAAHKLFINGRFSGKTVAKAVGELSDCLASDEILVAADNSDAKLDSLPFGVVAESECIGRVIGKLAPTVEPIE
ncbi:MAG TPA: signal peptidase I [Drouetiella sp.]